MTGTPPATGATVSELKPGSSYTFTVQASNPDGSGEASKPSNAVTPTAPTAPSEPTGVTARAGDGSATVTWTAPSNGGSPITKYTVTPYVGIEPKKATTVTGTPPETSATITGLTDGTSYTFEVTANNAVGEGPPSIASNAVIPTAQDTIFGSATPATIDSGDGNSVELGVKFSSTVAGSVTGIRFYKASTNSGTHIGSLWSASGTLLASATFTGESASGWQQVNFSTPVAIAASTTYIAGYLAPNGHYSDTASGFATAVSSPPLLALANSTSANGVYAYSSTSVFPASSYNATNYWVDVDFEATPTTAPGQVTNVSATAGPGSASLTWSAPSSGGAVTKYTITPYLESKAQTATTVTGTPPATGATVGELKPGSSYTFTVTASNTAGSGEASKPSNAVTPTAPTVPSEPTGVTARAGDGSATVTWTAPLDGGSPITKYTVTPYVGTEPKKATTVTGTPPETSATITGLTDGTSYTFEVTANNGVGEGPPSIASNAVIPTVPDTIFGSATPATIDSGDGSSVELGVKFSSTVAGSVTGIRFYKASTNSGTHIGSLWSASGTLLASATFTGESASGWQQVNFSTPVAIAASTTYIAGYLAPNGHYSDTESGFATAVSSPPLLAPANSTSANGVYAYSSTSVFPASSYKATNYWVDVDFVEATPTTTPGQVTNVSATAGTGSASLTWSAPSSGGAVTKYTITPYLESKAQTATTVTGTPPATGATVGELKPGSSYTFTVTASNTAGSGEASKPSNAVTPTAPTVPSEPTGVTARAGDGSATVTWTAPLDGGSPITKYTVTPYVGTEPKKATTVTGTPPETSATITGLTNGTSYTFKVTANNGVGEGPPSIASNAVIPTVPDTIFGSATPATIDSGDGSSVELGVKFSSDSRGQRDGHPLL